MGRWRESRIGRLTRLQTALLVVAGIAAATIVADATEATGPVGPAGVFFTLVLVVAVFGGPGAGLVTTAIAAAVLWSGFTEPRWSFDIEGARGVADVAAFTVVGTVLTIILDRLVRAREETQHALSQVDAMVRHSPVGMAFVDRDLRYVEVNEALTGLSERDAGDFIGRRVDDIDDLEVDGAWLAELIAEVLRTGQPKLDVPFTSVGPRSGRPRAVVAGFYPVTSDGATQGVGIVVREVTAEHQRDLLFDRVSRLQGLAAALATAGSIDEVVDTAVHSMQRAVGAVAASFCVTDGDIVRIAGSVGYSEEITQRWCTFPLVEDVPLAASIRTREPVLVADRDALIARWPHLESSMVWGGSRSVAALPLRGESNVFGSIGLSFTEERTFDPDQVSFLVAAATQCATAYERAVSFEAEREARQAAEAANSRLGYLSEATAVLGASLDPITTMQRLAQLAVPTLAEWCAVHLVEGDMAVPVAVASENPEATAMVRDLSERHPIPIDSPAGLGEVVRTGEPIVLNSVTMEAVRASTSADELVDLLSRLRSIAIVPMAFQGRVIGTITLSNTIDRTFDDADLSLARELAARAAQAVTNARLFQERTRVASTLQASLLPPSPTIIPGVDVATRFVAAAEGLDVGGDFYDVFRLGTIDDPAPTWALVIGDVRGKGADAAAITGIARATVRAAALDEASPALMLGRLNQVLLAAAQDDRFSTETGEPRFCTAVVATVMPTESGAELVVAVGGHPLPYVIRTAGIVEQVGEAGDLIGVLPSPDLADVKVHLAPGDSFVLYTDGVTERHAGRVFFDEEGLVEVLEQCLRCSAVEVAERIEDAARGFVDEEPKDDLAVVVAQVPPVATTGTVARSELPSDERAAALARRFVQDTLEELGAGDVTEVAILLTSELVTNALLHGAPPMRAEVLAVPDGVRVAIADGHPGLPTPRNATRDDEHGRGLLLVGVLSARWGVDAQPPGKSVWFELTW